jgi:class 3 adenylate cyclase/tetratricopeptide (TPR) repeat protein
MECGTALAVACPVCGAQNDPGSRFCGECGSSVGAPPTAVGTPAPAVGLAPAPIAERKLVSVLFADLVGFTAMSESRDPEEVRDFLTTYFDTARRIVDRYGGTIEKFIGDAVMAVWGTPVAQEDDAERAVRAALDLAAGAVGGADDAGRDPRPQIRAAVCTGEAAVTLGAEGQGMVAGDLVNTASRLQSVATGGAVLVDDSTRRTAEAAVVFEEAGAHDVKGKAEPVHAWRAMRVIAGRGGALRSVNLEAPFVGRDRELRLIKELFHSSTEQRKAHLVSVLGIAGIGKSRLSWEFFKYMDGLVEPVRWHRGRCLAYGEGVSYWALGEMVRMRAGIAEGEELDSALQKLRRAIEEYVPDPEERKWIEPRLAHLLGGEGEGPGGREELFPAWRLFFERVADRGPTVMVFEDLQWADTALIDFIEYLLEWSRNLPLFVITLARPEVEDRHPNWSSGKRSFTSFALEPLPPGAMEQLLTGLVPGLPDTIRSQIQARAEGVPLYAVETVRMLIDRGLLVRERDGYRPAGPIEALEVPETLHALIAARLDGLEPLERRLIQDAAVLGKTFSTDSLSSLTGVDRAELATSLGGLVRKEVLGLQADPRSPEHGQYGFLQDLVRRVAYETLSRRDRKIRHLAAADYLERSWAGDDAEIAEIVASHYVEAYRLQPDTEDAGPIRARAREALVRAANRAASLGASSEAQRYFDQALELTDDDAEAAGLAEQAGAMAYAMGRFADALARFERSIALFESQGASHAAARATARLGEVMWLGMSQLREGLARMEQAFDVLSGDEPDEGLATLAAQIGRLYWFTGAVDLAEERLDFALRIAEDQLLWEVLSQALNTKSLLLVSRRRYQEALALLQQALAIAQEHDLPWAMERAMFNMADQLHTSGRYEEALQLDLEGRARGRRRGDRTHESMCMVHLCHDYLALGRWDDLMEVAAAATGPEMEVEGAWAPFIRSLTIPVLVARGQIEELEERYRSMEQVSDAGEVQDRLYVALSRARVRRAQGKLDDALEAAELGVSMKDTFGLPGVTLAIVEALEAAFALERLDKVEGMLDELEAESPSQRTPVLEGHMARFRGKLAASRGEGEPAEWFDQAAGVFRSLGSPFPLAIVLLELGEWLMGVGRAEDAEPPMAEARSIFEGLRATPWLERVAASQPASAAVS